MEYLVWIAIAVAFAFWSYSLAKKKEKGSPAMWAVGGFFFNVIPIFALSALPEPDDLRFQMQQIMRKELDASR